MTRTNGSQELERAAAGEGRNTPIAQFRHLLERSAPAITIALPPGTMPGGPERFARIVQTAVTANPDLLRCDHISIIGAAIQAAQLGLTPNLLGEAWMVPYAGQCTFQIGYKGLIKLAARTGLRVVARTVHRNDHFRYGYSLDGDILEHTPAEGDRGDSHLWYAIITDTRTGERGFAVVDRAHVDKRQKVSRGKSPAWAGWYDEMALSKAIREALKYWPLSVDDPLAQAFLADGRVRTDLEASPVRNAELEGAKPWHDDDDGDGGVWGGPVWDGSDDGRPFDDDGVVEPVVEDER